MNNFLQFKTPEQPRQVRLDSTTTCNAKCPTCHRFLSDREGKMDKDLLDEVLEDISKWKEPLEEIIPVNYGEFFTLPDWYEVLKLISFKLPDTHITIPTNGSLLDKEKAKALCSIPSLYLVNFSINAFLPDVYEAFMGLPAKTMIQIREVVKVIQSYRPKVTLWASFIHLPCYHTEMEKEMFCNFWKSIGVEPQVLTPASAGLGVRMMVPSYLPCRSIFSDLVIGYDKRLSSCCFDAGFKIQLSSYTGNIKRDWRNSRLEGLRKLHNDGKRGQIELCAVCTFA